MKAMKNGPALLGLRKPLMDWLPEMNRMAGQLLQERDDQAAHHMMQLAATSVAALQLLDLLERRLALGNSEGLGVMPGPK